MSLIVLGNFIEVTGDGAGVQRFQNANTNGTIGFGGATYNFLSFIYQGATKNRTGDNLQSTLVLANNPISLGLGVEAVEKRWKVRVDTCSLTRGNLSVAKTLSTENWIVSNVAYDPVTVEITLSSSIDAVGAVAPNRVLTQKQVGALPVSGQIQNR